MHTCKMTHLITYLIYVKENIKLYHWYTTLYPRHIATDNLYERLSGNIDKLVEIYIGKYGRQKLSKSDLTLVLNPLNDSTIVGFVEDVVSYLLTQLPRFIKQEDVDILTLRDDIVSDLSQAKYLFSMK